MSCPFSVAIDSTAKANAIAEAILELHRQHEKDIAELKAKYEREIASLKQQISKLKSGNAHSDDSTDVPEQPSPVSKSGVDSWQSGPLAQTIFIESKPRFIEFLQKAVKSKETPEFKQLYLFLLKCFTDADNNFDGRVGFQDFDMLIEAAASLPKRFGYAPSTPELYATDWDRLKSRMALFKSLGPKKAPKIDHSSLEAEYEYISFDMWLNYAITHITEKAKLLKDVDPTSKMDRTAGDFQQFIINACTSRSTTEYKEFYHFVLMCFTEADTDLDGLIDFESFFKLIDIAAAAPRRFGFAPPASEIYQSEHQQREARAEIFAQIDVNKTGYIDFDSWLHYIYTHICEKTAPMMQKDGNHDIVPKVTPPISGHKLPNPF
jgi:Ca2+-binding EF-hand superfamily protein